MRFKGQCRLCGNEAELRDSHFIPQAAYKRVRGQGPNPHPIVIHGRKVIQTAAQTRAHVLCQDCEQLFSTNGENAFFRNCYSGPGQFRLLEILSSQPPLLEDDRFAVHSISEGETAAVEQMGYMGLSVLWKSAAHSWKDRGGTLPSISMGSPYQEQVRNFLLKIGPFPEHGAMILEVSDENNRLIAVTGTPSTSKWPTHYLHCIDICGVRFNLLLGGRMPMHFKELSVFRPGRKCVLIAKRQESMLAQTYRERLEALAGLP